MASKQSQPEGLKGNKNREASDIVRGFGYQIWHSVYAWLNLSENDFLFLEGAEDFDVIQPEGATTYQVKATASKITLRSKQAQDAIRHFWEIKQGNKGRIVYRLITQSQIGVEQGNPFGMGTAGLSLWQRCNRQPEGIEAIRNFLVSKRFFSQLKELEGFIANSPADVLFRELIEPISWDTSQEDTAAVEEAVKRRLVYHGESQGVPPSTAEKVANCLFKEAFTHAATKGLRRLERADFLRLFEKETRVSVPFSQFEAGLQAIAQRMAGQESSGVGASLQLLPLVQTTQQALPFVTAPRENVVNQIGKQLTQMGLVAVTGSTGTGKTILAKLVTQQSALPLLRVQFTGLSVEQTHLVLSQVSRLVGEKGGRRTIVLDDLDLSPGRLAPYENILLGTIFAAMETGGQIIVTSQSQFPQKLTRQLNLELDPVFRAPPMDADEITDFAVRFGCKDPALASQWARLILLQTKGHPQLVHARLISIRNAGWPKLTASELTFRPPEIVEDQKHARQQLMSEVSMEERDLVYRLSVVAGAVRRDQAVAIGEISPPIRNPGDAFDNLVGPWIEPAGGEYYRLSPLLDKSAEDAWSRSVVAALHEPIGIAIVRSGKLTQFDASTILFHALASKSEQLIVGLTTSLLEVDFRTKQSVAEQTQWVTHLYAEPNTSPFCEKPFLNWVFRFFQFDTACRAATNQAAKLAGCLDIELSEDKLGDLYSNCRFLFVTYAITSFRVALRPARLLQYLHEAAYLQSVLITKGESPEVYAFESMRRSLGKGSFDLAAFLFPFIVIRCSDMAFLNELLVELESARDKYQQHLSKFYADGGTDVWMLIDRAWLGEEKRESPDWDAALNICSRLVELGASWDIPKLVQSAVRGMVIICDEYLNDRSRADSVLKKYAALVPAPEPMFEDGRATLLLHEGKNEEALKIWEGVLPLWDVERNSDDLNVLFAHRKAGLAAVEAGLLEKAAELFLQGAEKARTIGDSQGRAFEVGFLTDGAYQLWKAGFSGRAVLGFIQATTKLQQLPIGKDDLFAFKVGKVLGQTLISVEGAISGTNNERAYPMPAGAGSNPEAPEKLRELPDSPIDIIWAFVSLIEVQLEQPPTAYNLCSDRLAKSPFPTARFYHSQITASRAISLAEVSTLPSLAQELALLMRLTKSHPNLVGNQLMPADPSLFATLPIADDFSSASQVLFAGLVSLAARGNLGKPALQQWRDVSKSLVIGEILIRWLDALQETLALTATEACTLMKTRNSSGEKQIFAALRLSIDDSLATDDLFYAQVTLVWYISHNPFRVEIGKLLSPILARQWNEKSKFRATLRAPQVSVPQIEGACREQTEGIRKTARILLAAANAVSIGLPEGMRQTLKELEVA